MAKMSDFSTRKSLNSRLNGRGPKKWPFVQPERRSERQAKIDHNPLKCILELLNDFLNVDCTKLPPQGQRSFSVVA
jgi:hypothetical protein